MKNSNDTIWDRTSDLPITNVKIRWTRVYWIFYSFIKSWRVVRFLASLSLCCLPCSTSIASWYKKTLVYFIKRSNHLYPFYVLSDTRVSATVLESSTVTSAILVHTCSVVWILLLGWTTSVHCSSTVNKAEIDADDDVIVGIVTRAAYERRKASKGVWTV